MCVHRRRPVAAQQPAATTAANEPQQLIVKLEQLVAEPEQSKQLVVAESEQPEQLIPQQLVTKYQQPEQFGAESG